MSSIQAYKSTKPKSGKSSKSSKYEISLRITVLKRMTFKGYKMRKENKVIYEPKVAVNELPKLDENTMFEPTLLNSYESPETLDLTQDDILSTVFSV